LLAALTHGIDTDDGSIGPSPSDDPAKAEGAREKGPTPATEKKAPAKPRPKNKPAGSPAAAARPKPPPSGDDGETPTKPRAATKPAAAPRDFEP
ncbi:MAG TPA: hypothetical protein VFK05_12665, partial [Polyangiaceae bacterium]|nr:hypothetical protein [Polyangiaceae bacterium]